ncbi:MAG TPA: adenylate/guanylate cyclase domain-containing protein [Mycobacterium sp.]|nr:adenylate/guanylate cyclase domain-containing protein [Mycobacterium sp.]
MTARVACASCGTGLRENAKFCGECGASTAARADAPEYKQVTVLFADVVCSMGIAAVLDIERLREVMTELMERSAAVVRRYGGTVESTGDGVMAIFGAPVALEDHAFRACLAALAIQEEAKQLAAAVKLRDGVALRVRVGLNSGQVIAGDIGSGSLGYTAIGMHVGMAQRMEAAAPPGGVLLSESTAQLVEHVTVVTESDWVHIKGADDPVRARQLLGITSRRRSTGRAETALVGRRWETAAINAVIDRAIRGHGGFVNIVGPPGIGKSRMARETAALAATRGADVFWTYSESHASAVPFHTARRLLREVFGIEDLVEPSARARVREQLPNADPQDVLLLDDLLEIADPDVALPKIDPSAGRRRLTALINTVTLARTTPALFVIEDVHWIDAASESMLADFLAVVPQALAMVLITARPEYHGALARMRGAHTIALVPLGDSDATALLGELLGSNLSVGDITAVIADRAAGNPFFAHEMVRELEQRGVLRGSRGDYVCDTDVADVTVPATVQAAIEARIDRLDSAAKRTLNAASVIGSRFGPELLTALGIDPMLDELVATELIDQIDFTPHPRYAFHHPLIRAVAYESQLKSDRADVHRRLAAAIESRSPQSADHNAALIAEHLEAAGELRAAYAWHMRAGGWSVHRDIAAARVSWERARQIADALPDDDPNTLAMRIAPRTMLCVSAWRAEAKTSGFDELRALCALAGDKASLAIAMTGRASELLWSGRTREASRLASEQMALLESIGDSTLTIAAAYVAIIIKSISGEIADVLRWSQIVIDLANGDPTIGANFSLGSPLAAALVHRGIARCWLGRDGWRQDLDDAVAMARNTDPATHAVVVGSKYAFTIASGVFQTNASAMREIEEALINAEGLSDETMLAVVRCTLGGLLLTRDAPADRHRGLEMVEQVRDRWMHEQSRLYLVPMAQVFAAHGRAMRGERESAIPTLRRAVTDMLEAQQFTYGLIATAVLVEVLLDRGTEDDVVEADSAVDRAARLLADEGLVLRDIVLLRLRTLILLARGDDVAYRASAMRYLTMAKSLGFEGHIATAEAMQMSQGVR